MNTQRVTVSLPKYIHDELLVTVNKRQLSRFVAETIEKRLLDQKTDSVDPIEKFFGFRKKTPKVSNQTISAAIKRGRI